MRIACLAWGSLFWDPRTLPHEPPFYSDGFPLPIEFSRVSLDGRVTLIIDPAAPVRPTLWVRMTSTSLDGAVRGLGEREKITPPRWDDWVGRHVRGEPLHATAQPRPIFEDLDAWLEARGLDAAVWTALPARSASGEAGDPGRAALEAHLRGLEGEARRRAEEYIRRTPESIRPPRRAHFERALGWTPLRGSGASPITSGVQAGREKRPR